MSEYASMAPPEEPNSEFERWVYDMTKKNNSLLTRIATSLCSVAPPPPPPLPREPTPPPLPAPVHTGKEEQASSSTLLLHGKIKDCDSHLIDLGRSKIHSGSFTLLSFSTEQDASKALDLMSEQQQQRPLPFSFKPATISELSPDKLRNCNYISPPHPLPFFWDFENITIPNDYDAKMLYAKMERFLGSQNFKMTQPKGFGSREAISRKNWPLLKDEFGLQHVDGSKVKEVADFMIKRSLLLHLIDEPQPCPCLVFTGDQDFEQVFKFLQDRGYHMYLGHNNEAPPELKSVVTKAWHYHHIIDYVERTTEEKKNLKRKRKNQKRKRNSLGYKVKKQQKGAGKLMKLEQEAQRLRLEQDALRLLDELEAKGSSTKHGENKEVDPETPSQKKQIKEDSRSRRQLKGSQKQEKSSPTKHGENEEVEDPEMPSQEKQIKGNSKSRRQLKRPQKQEKSSLTKQGENEDATQKSGKKRQKR